MDTSPQSLIFITSTDASIPQGRNARAQTRSQITSRYNPSQSRQTGSFSHFTLQTPPVTSTPRRRRRLPKLDDAKSQRLSPARPMPSTTYLPLTYSPSPVDPAAILALARFHICRTSVLLAQFQPERLHNALRWRHWTHSPIAPIAAGERTVCVDSALTCLAVKLDDLLSTPGDSASNARVLAVYDRSLADLRRALAGSHVVRREDLLVTAQLLAVFEMLHNPDGDSWTKHAVGAVSLLMCSKPKHVLSRTCGWPVLTESLLDTGTGCYAKAPRKALAKLILRSYDNNAQELTPIIFRAASLLDTFHTNPTLSNSQSFALLATAHDLRDRLTQLAKRSPHIWRRPLSNDGFDHLGFGLVCLVALDRVIVALRPSGPRTRGPDVDEETHSICVQLLTAEMADVERYPDMSRFGKWGS